jgi:CO/xanthine dehydrogenase FAD-binding subunit
MPLMQIERYHRPSDVDAAWRLLTDGDGTAVLVGGGTDLVVRCPADVRALIDLGAVGLRYVRSTEAGGLHLGAMSTFTDLLEHPAVATYGTGVLGEMLAQVGSVLHRNSATIGGHVVRSRLSDVLPVLLALDASVVVYDGERTEYDLADYLARDPAPHVVVEVRLPPRIPGSAAAFTRFSRTAFDHALVNACCRVDVDDEVVVAARVVVGESATVGQRVEVAERQLVGGPFTAEAVTAAVEATRTSVTCRGDWIATADYRRHLAGVAVERCLHRVADRLEGGAT